jgi:hypothetical protein
MRDLVQTYTIAFWAIIKRDMVGFIRVQVEGGAVYVCGLHKEHPASILRPGKI